MEVLLARCLLLDLETHPGNAGILKIGALFCEQTWLRQDRFQLDAALTRLDKFAAKADFVLGHICYITISPYCAPPRRDCACACACSTSR